MNFQGTKELKFILKDLKKLIEGEVLFDEPSRTIYGSAASIYRIRPENDQKEGRKFYSPTQKTTGSARG